MKVYKREDYRCQCEDEQHSFTWNKITLKMQNSLLSTLLEIVKENIIIL